MENVIRDLFAIVDAGAWDRLSTVFHAEVVYERPGYDPISGLAAIDAFYRGVRVIAGGVHGIEGIACTGSSGAAWGEFQGTLKTGQPIRERFADVYGFRDGRIVHRRTHFFRPAV